MHRLAYPAPSGIYWVYLLKGLPCYQAERLARYMLAEHTPPYSPMNGHFGYKNTTRSLKKLELHTRHKELTVQFVCFRFLGTQPWNKVRAPRLAATLCAQSSRVQPTATRQRYSQNMRRTSSSHSTSLRPRSLWSSATSYLTRCVTSKRTVSSVDDVPAIREDN
ncbi:hypothetical protein CC77DRAFT_25689 [Alternaria alternata]|uniref:Uncharacterized protein n=1 Tax=Alternaria alternata TaxID=5599 RepID=A0A177E2B7_ALTAL|nr:hypothetical protein CC77DRAFT_25689 [Alternaria alternata]OAG26117.1 hypothetical protein CC77DRAFT_25689 [Alternaria alternata]